MHESHEYWRYLPKQIKAQIVLLGEEQKRVAGVVGMTEATFSRALNGDGRLTFHDALKVGGRVGLPHDTTALGWALQQVWREAKSHTDEERVDLLAKHVALLPKDASDVFDAFERSFRAQGLSREEASVVVHELLSRWVSSIDDESLRRQLYADGVLVWANQLGDGAYKADALEAYGCHRWARKAWRSSAMLSMANIQVEVGQVSEGVSTFDRLERLFGGELSELERLFVAVFGTEARALEVLDQNLGWSDRAPDLLSTWDHGLEVFANACEKRPWWTLRAKVWRAAVAVMAGAGAEDAVRQSLTEVREAYVKMGRRMLSAYLSTHYIASVALRDRDLAEDTWNKLKLRRAAGEQPHITERLQHLLR